VRSQRIAPRRRARGDVLPERVQEALRQLGAAKEGLLALGHPDRRLYRGSVGREAFSRCLLLLLFSLAAVPTSGGTGGPRPSFLQPMPRGWLIRCPAARRPAVGVGFLLARDS